MADLEPDEILTNIINGPASVSGDAGSVTQQDPLKVIEVDKYQRQKAAGARGGLRGISFVKIIPPGNG